MSEYISREIAKEKIGNLDGFGVIGRCLDEIPSADVIPVKWIEEYIKVHISEVIVTPCVILEKSQVEIWKK